MQQDLKKVLKKTQISSETNSEKLYYLNLINGIIYELNPDLIEQLGVEVVDGTHEITSLDELRKESLRIMDEYIMSSCF